MYTNVTLLNSLSFPSTCIHSQTRNDVKERVELYICPVLGHNLLSPSQRRHWPYHEISSCPFPLGCNHPSCHNCFHLGVKNRGAKTSRRRNCALFEGSSRELPVHMPLGTRLRVQITTRNACFRNTATHISGTHVHHDKTFRKTVRRVELRDAAFTDSTPSSVSCDKSSQGR